MNCKKRLTVLTLLMTLTLSAGSYAQDSKRGDSSKSSQQTERACLQLIAEIEAKEKEIKVLQADKADLQIIRQALDDKVKLLEKLLSLYESDIEKLRKAGTLDNQAIGELKAQRERYKEELETTRKERDRARKLLRRVGTGAAIIGAIIGGIVGWLIGK